MSLVVARKNRNACYIVSDTHWINHLKKEEATPLQGVVKSSILSPNLCVCFAGDLDSAGQALRTYSVYDDDSNLVTRTVDHFLNHHHLSNKGTDFILAFGSPHNKLVEIKDGSCQEVLAAWIGSHNAFNRFQGYMSMSTDAIRQELKLENAAEMYILKIPEHPDTDDILYEKMKASMFAVIQALEVPEVGGIVVPVAIHQGGFKYMDYVDIITHPIRFDLLPTNTWNVVPFGTAMEGGYAFNFMGTTEGQAPRAAMYFLQGNFGVLFLPEEAGYLAPHLLTNVSPLDFVERLKLDYGLKVHCVFSTPNMS